MGEFDSLLSLSSRIAPRAIHRSQSSKHFLASCLTVLPAGFPHGTTVPGAAWVFFSHCFHQSVSYIPHLPALGTGILAGSSSSSPSLCGSVFPLILSMESSPVLPPCFKDDVLGQDFLHAVGSFLFDAAVLSQFTLSRVDNRNRKPFALGGFEPECF